MNIHINPHKRVKSGPGGFNCHCCFPAPNSGARKAEFRKAKRRVDRELQKYIQDELRDIQDTQDELHAEMLNAYDGLSDDDWEWLDECCEAPDQDWKCKIIDEAAHIDFDQNWTCADHKAWQDWEAEDQMSCIWYTY